MITLYDDDVRTIVEIPEQDIQGLDALCSREHISRAEAVRRAVTDYLKLHQGDADAAFGLWQGRGVDGLTYQDGIRDEWSVPTIHEPVSPD
jgi:hypothetical protein